MSNYRISAEDVQDVLNKADYIVKEFGPRLPGTTACIEAADYIKKEFSKYCDRVDENKLHLYPAGFFYIPTIIATTYLAGTLLFFIPQTKILSIAVLLFGLIYFVSQFVFFTETFDKLFRKAPGKNIFGTIEPKKKLKQQIIISSHHDSPYICNFLSKHQKLYSFRIIIPIVFYVYILLTVVLTTSGILVLNRPFYSISIIAASIGCFFVVPLFWYNNKKGSPGVGDNILSTMIGIKVLKVIKEKCKALDYTRIIVLSNDGEEIGQKGVQHFVKTMDPLINECKTNVINIDSIHKYDDLALLITDRNGTIRLSQNLASEVKTVTEKLGYKIEYKKFPFGGGGTDAAHFARKNIPSTSLIGISTNFIRDNLYYHTIHDTVENIDAAAVEAVLNIIINYLEYKDVVKVPKK